VTNNLNLYIKKFILYWLPVIIWAIVIFIFSANPTTRASEIHWQDFVVKKTAHVFIYAILTTLLYRSLIASGLDTKKSAVLSTIIAILYGFSDEFHQSFTPGREPKLRDVFFDTFGSATAAYLILNRLKFFPERIRTLARKLEILK